jgi:hypothetical protein
LGGLLGSARRIDGWWRAVEKDDIKRGYCEELREKTHLVRLVEDGKRSLVVGFRGVFEVLDVGTDDLTVGDEEPLSVDHVRDHHNLIRQLIGELERRFCCFDIESENDGFGTGDTLFEKAEGNIAGDGGDLVPESDSNLFRQRTGQSRSGERKEERNALLSIATRR